VAVPQLIDYHRKEWITRVGRANLRSPCNSGMNVMSLLIEHLSTNKFSYKFLWRYYARYGR